MEQSLFETLSTFDKPNVYTIQYQLVQYLVNKSITVDPQHILNEWQYRNKLVCIIQQQLGQISQPQLDCLCSKYNVNNKNELLNHIIQNGSLSVQDVINMKNNTTVIVIRCNECNSLYITKCSKCTILKTIQQHPTLFGLTINVTVQSLQQSTWHKIFLNDYQVQTQFVETGDIQLYMLSPNTTHQQFYQDVSPDICGGMILVNGENQYKNEIIFDEATNVLCEKISNMKILKKYSDAFTLHEFVTIMDEFNDEVLIQIELNNLAQFVQANELNEMIQNGEHPLFRMSPREIACTQLFYPKCTMKVFILLPMTEEIESNLKRGEWPPDVEHRFKYLNDSIRDHQKTPVFGVEYKEHYFNNQLFVLNSKILNSSNDKTVAKLINMDSKNPPVELWDQSRPFIFISKMIINFHHFQKDIFLGLRLCDQITENIMKLSQKTEVGRDYLANIFQSLINNGTLPFNLNNQNENNQNVVESLLLEELSLNININNHKNMSDDHYKLQLLRFISYTSQETFEKLQHILGLNKQEFLYPFGISTLSHIQTYYCTKYKYIQWDANILNIVETFHCVTDRMKWEVSTMKWQSEIENCLNVVQKQAKSLYNKLFQPSKCLTNIKDITCPRCIEVLKMINY
eukprot:128714_1